MVSDAKKKANAKWDKANMMILGCRVRRSFAADFRAACAAAGTTPNAVLKQAAEDFMQSHPMPAQMPAEAAENGTRESAVEQSSHKTVFAKVP